MQGKLHSFQYCRSVGRENNMMCFFLMLKEHGHDMNDMDIQVDVTAMASLHTSRSIGVVN